MKRSATVLFLLTLCAPFLMAGDLAKPYFKSTHPGAWASYKSTTEGIGEYRYTEARLPDRDGRAVVEFKMEVVSGPGTGTTTQQIFVMEPGFDLAMNAIGRMKATEVMVIQAGEGDAMLQPEAVVSAIREGSCDYDGVFTPKGRDKVNGLDCDVYSFEARCGRAASTTTVQGEYCLSDAVPFGIVRQTSVSRGSDGKVTSRSVQLLEDYGTDYKGSRMLLAKLTEQQGYQQSRPEVVPKSVPVQEAYRRGQVEIHVETVPGSSGKRLLLTLRNKTGEEIVVDLPSGSASFEAGSPLGSLEIAVDSSETFKIAAGASTAAFEVAQRGRRGAAEGDFTILTYEGEPLYSGSVSVGPLG